MSTAISRSASWSLWSGYNNASSIKVLKFHWYNYFLATSYFPNKTQAPPILAPLIFKDLVVCVVSHSFLVPSPLSVEAPRPPWCLWLPHILVPSEILWYTYAINPLHTIISHLNAIKFTSKLQSSLPVNKAFYRATWIWRDNDNMIISSLVIWEDGSIFNTYFYCIWDSGLIWNY